MGAHQRSGKDIDPGDIEGAFVSGKTQGKAIKGRHDQAVDRSSGVGFFAKGRVLTVHRQRVCWARAAGWARGRRDARAARSI